MRVIRLEQGNGDGQEGREYGGEETCLGGAEGFRLSFALDSRGTYKDEKSIDVVRKVGNHIFVMAQDGLLDKLPALECGSILSQSEPE